MIRASVTERQFKGRARDSGRNSAILLVERSVAHVVQHVEDVAQQRRGSQLGEGEPSILGELAEGR